MKEIIDALPALFSGAGVTIELTMVSVFFGIIIGLILALGRLSKIKVLEYLSRLYVWFFRGTPLLMQIFFIYYALPTIGGKPLTFSSMTSAFIALSLNSGAYLAEIIRAAIQSIDKGQMEAAKAIGMSYGQAMRRIVIPQSYRRLIPPVGNEFIALLKDSALVSVIGMTELMRSTTQISNAAASTTIYIPAVLIYLLMTTIFSFVFGRLEKKFSLYE
jgi:polar amino acid transport system permease protein